MPRTIVETSMREYDALLALNLNCFLIPRYCNLDKSLPYIFRRFILNLLRIMIIFFNIILMFIKYIFMILIIHSYTNFILTFVNVLRIRLHRAFGERHCRQMHLTLMNFIGTITFGVRINRLPFTTYALPGVASGDVSFVED